MLNPSQRSKIQISCLEITNPVLLSRAIRYENILGGSVTIAILTSSGRDIDKQIYTVFLQSKIKLRRQTILSILYNLPGDVVGVRDGKIVSPAQILLKRRSSVHVLNTV
jgi:hypothetical protein